MSVRAIRLTLLLAISLFALTPYMRAQETGTTPSDPPAAPRATPPALTMFPHPDTTPWYVAGQANIIFQAHPPFHSPYEGPHSFHGAGEYKTSLVGTLYLGYQPFKTIRYNTDLILDVESAGGRGLSEAFGLAGFTNLDVVRNPSLGSAPYIARVQIHQTIGLTEETVESERGPLALATVLPARRFDIRVGKLGTVDIFDLNSVGSDSHLQFTNWTVDNNGAYDYAADTRGYTYGAVLEYADHDFSARYGLMLMSKVANGIDLVWNVRQARGQNMEFELRKSPLPKRKGAYRVLSYVNIAHMGNYREAVEAFVAGIDPTPDITKHEHFGAVKYGFGFNFDQEISDNARVFARVGWNDGATESFEYTEVDQTVEVGGDYRGTRWGRSYDKAGVAFVSNAIKRDHQNYLANGGLGFLLGDGRLHYGRENIEEAYYNAHAYKGLFFALGLHHIDNPGYNRDRGPVWVPSVRAHVDF